MRGLLLIPLFSAVLTGCGYRDVAPDTVPMTMECADAIERTAERFKELVVEEYSDTSPLSPNIQAQLVDHRKRAYWAASDYEVQACKNSTLWNKRTIPKNTPHEPAGVKRQKE
jgi:hypothetical protein